MKHKIARGFTLIEILVVIGLIAILAAIVLIAINPARQFAQARNTQRQSNIETILNAVGQNLADNKGLLSSTCPTIGDATASTSASALGVCLVPTYIAAGVPSDPSLPAGTDYQISFDGTRYLVCAPNSKEVALGSPAIMCLKR